MQQFEVGKTYSTRSIGDHNCIISVTIAKRAAKTVTTTQGKTFRPRVSCDGTAEMIRPWGAYSMCPFLYATDTAARRPDWERDAAIEEHAAQADLADAAEGCESC